MEIDGYILCWWYAENTCLLSSDSTLDLVHSKSGYELNRFIQKLNLKIITIDCDKTVYFIEFSKYNCTQG